MKGTLQSTIPVRQKLDPTIWSTDSLLDWERTSLKPYVDMIDRHALGLMEEVRKSKRGAGAAYSITYQLRCSADCTLPHREYVVVNLRSCSLNLTIGCAIVFFMYNSWSVVFGLVLTITDHSL